MQKNNVHCLTRLSMRLSDIRTVIAIIIVVAGTGYAGAGSFDWRDIDGKNYVTPVRDQGAANMCWAFSAIGALEAKLKITADAPSWNPDLSEQHLVMHAYYTGDVDGGYELRAMGSFSSYGVVSEAELPYTASNESTNWPLAPGSEDRLYKSSGNAFAPNNTDGVKQALRDNGPLVASMNIDRDWHELGSDVSEEPIIPPDPEDRNYNHAVLIVGYQDVAEDVVGGYWIVKNSWGTVFQDDGYGYVRYRVLESYNRVLGLTGDAYYTGGPLPEPATISLLAIGALTMIGRRKRK